jgi:hypothetical protein
MTNGALEKVNAAARKFGACFIQEVNEEIEKLFRGIFLDLCDGNAGYEDDEYGKDQLGENECDIDMKDIKEGGR